MTKPLGLASYLTLLTLGVVGLNLFERNLIVAHPDQLGSVAFLVIAGMVLNVPEVRIDRGRLTLTAIASGAAAVLLNPLDATIVGLACSVGVARRGGRLIVMNAVMQAWISCVGAVVAAQFYTGGPLPLGARVIALGAAIVANWLTVTLALSVSTGESPYSIVHHLREIDPRRLDPVDRDSLETATAAATDAVTVLRDLSQGATPRVTYAANPIDLNELVARAIGMARPRARTKEVQLAVRESPEVVNVRADPLLMREVITNLLNNAIDAVGQGGRVDASTGRRGNGWPYFSIADNGPGVSDDQRHHLFEPHFTTKEGGTGLGLFMSYGIVREHQGQLLYEGSRRGAVFTVTIPPFGG